MTFDGLGGFRDPNRAAGVEVDRLLNSPKPREIQVRLDPLPHDLVHGVDWHVTRVVAEPSWEAMHPLSIGDHGI